MQLIEAHLLMSHKIHMLYYLLSSVFHQDSLGAHLKHTQPALYVDPYKLLFSFLDQALE